MRGVRTGRRTIELFFRLRLHEASQPTRGPRREAAGVDRSQLAESPCKMKEPSCSAASSSHGEFRQRDHVIIMTTNRYLESVILKRRHPRHSEPSRAVISASNIPRQFADFRHGKPLQSQSSGHHPHDTQAIVLRSLPQVNKDQGPTATVPRTTPYRPNLSVARGGPWNLLIPSH